MRVRGDALWVAGGILGALWSLGSLFTGLGGPIPAGDFVAFYTAGALALADRAADAYDPVLLRTHELVLAPEMAGVVNWRSPPSFFLFTAPLTLLPYPLAAGLFHLAGCALFVGAAARVDRRAVGYAAAMPLVCINATSIQTGPLVGGAWGHALALLDARPLLAGGMLGLVAAIKPHLAVVWPFLLVAQGRWRALAATAAATAGLVGLSVAWFGAEAWVAWPGALIAARAALGDGAVAGASSLYAALVALGVPDALASAVHLGSGALGVAVAVQAWRASDAGARGAAAMGATLLASPYLFYYDGALLGVGAAALATTGLRPGEAPLVALAWCGVGLAVVAPPAVPVVPALAWGLLAAAVLRRSRPAIAGGGFARSAPQRTP